MNKRIKLGFVGCGRHATINLYPCIPQIREIELMAVCDIKGELAKRNARNFGAIRHYASYQEMIDKENLDAVAVVGSPQMHTEIGAYALEHKLHLFLEKPPAIGSNEAKRIWKISRANNRFVQVGFMKRFSPGYNVAKQITSETSFGKITFIEARKSNGPYPGVWGLEPALAFLIGQGVHIFDLIQFFAGEVTTVTANRYDLARGRYAYGILVDFKNGNKGVVTLNSCQAWEKEDERVEITGDGAFIVIENMWEVKYFPRKEQDWIKPKGYTANYLHNSWYPNGSFADITNHSHYLTGYYQELQHFARSLLSHQEPMGNIKNGYKALRIAEAVWKSSNKKGAKMKLPAASSGVS